MLVRDGLLGLGIAALVVAGCGDDDDVACGDGTMLVAGECVATTGPDAGAGGDQCGAGTRPAADGTCIASDRPADQRSCAGRFGPVDEDAVDTVYVDASFAGTPDGTASAPFTGVQAAVDAAVDGNTVAIATGTYVGDVVVDRPLAIEGRCAREVVIEGSVTIDGAGASMHGVTVTGGAPGIVLRNAPGDVDAVGIRLGTNIVEMNGGAGVVVEAAAVSIDASEIRLTQAVAESTDLAEIGSGIYAHSASALVVTNSIVEMNGGVGVDVADATGSDARAAGGPAAAFDRTARSAGIVEMNIVEMNGLVGVRVGFLDGNLPAPGAPLVSVSSNIVEMNGLQGIEARASNVRLVGNVVINNGGSASGDPYAVAVTDTRMTITGNTLIGTAGGAVFAEFSTGVVAGNDVSGFDAVGIGVIECKDVAISNNTISDVGNAGIYAFEALSSAIVIDGNDVSGVRAMAPEPMASGHGIYISQFGNFNSDNFYAVRQNAVRDCEGTGISIDRVDPIDGSVPLYIVEMNVIERNQFAGINVQLSGDGDVVGNTVNANTGYGIRGFVAADGAARVRVNSNAVTNTAVSSIGGDTDGDGIAMIDSHVGVGTIEPGGTILANIVDGNARAGILAAGDTDGFCDGNEISLVTANGEYDLLIQGATATSGLATTGNQTLVGITSSVPELEATHGITSQTEPFDKPF